MTIVSHTFDKYAKWLDDKILHDVWESSYQGKRRSEYQQPITHTYNQASWGPSGKRHSTNANTYAIRATVIKRSTDRERKMNEREEEEQMDDKRD